MTATGPDPRTRAARDARLRQTETSSRAIASLVLGFLPTCGLGSILAIIFGLQARREIDAPDSIRSGRGMATAGIILGGIGLVANAVVWFLVITAVMSGASLP